MLLIAVGPAASARAQVLITPTGETNVSGVSEFFDAANMVNGSGLSGAATIGNYTTITHANASASTAWTTDDVPPAGGDYYAQGGTAGIFDFPLGSLYNITDLVFWGYHFGAPNGNEAREFNLSFSSDGGGSFPTNTVVSNPLSTFAVSSANTFSLGGSFQADVIRIDFTDNHFGGSAPGGDRIGVGEIKFIGTAVPEPSTALLAALAGCGLALRRHRPN